jgi:hypothetical protein
MRLTLALVLAAVYAGCGGGVVGDMVSEGDGMVPTETLGDWVSYGDQLAVVTVVHETPLKLPPDWKGSGGVIPREVTLRIDRALWHRPHAPSVGGLIRFYSYGWMMDDDQHADSDIYREVPAYGPRLEVGKRYLAMLVRLRGEWTVYTEAVMLLDGDRVTNDGVGDEPVEGARALKGKAVDEAAAIVAGTPPDPVAAAYGHLSPRLRYAKTAD